MEDTLNSLLLELEESKLLDTFCLLEGKKGVSHSSFLATVQAIHSQAKYKQPLVVDIDHESLWEQLNIVNRPLIRSFEKSVLRLMKKPMRSEALGEREKASAHPSRKTAQEHLEQEEHDEEQDYDEENDLNDEEIASDEDEEDENDLDKNQNQNNGDGSVAGESWVEAEANHSVGSEEGGMEAWLDEMEALDEKEQQRVEKELQQARTGGRLDDDDEEQQDGNDNEDDADLLLGVQSALYDSGSDMDSDTDGAAAAGNFKFSDFFKTEKRARKPGRTSAEKNQQVTALEEDEEEGEGEEEEESGEEEEEVEEEEEEGGGAVSGRAGVKDRRELLKARQSSSQQQRGAAALRNQIDSMESFLLQDKPWELRGEVAAKDRPQDSLLELAADIER